MKLFKVIIWNRAKKLVVIDEVNFEFRSQSSGTKNNWSSIDTIFFAQIRELTLNNFNIYLKA